MQNPPIHGLGVPIANGMFDLFRTSQWHGFPHIIQYAFHRKVRCSSSRRSPAILVGAWVGELLAGLSGDVRLAGVAGGTLPIALH